MQPKTVHETFISPTGTDIAMRNGWPFQKMKHDAEVVSDTQLQKVLVDEPPAVQAEVLAINDDARAASLQVAMMIPVLACLLGFLNAFRMVRLRDIAPSASERMEL
jgi:hypothetical protein